MKRLKRFLKIALLITIGFSAVLTIPFRWINPPTSAFALQDQSIQNLFLAERWTPIENIAPIMQMAVIASEDQKFIDHYGFDLDSLASAIYHGGSKGGGSTISQQLAKNLYLWSGRSYVRKGIEAYLTLWIEASWPKKRILEVYLNVVEFGPGIYGIHHASEHFFKKTPDKLNASEASLLAAVLPAPKRYSVSRPSSYIRGRSIKIQRFIRQLGGIQFLPWLEG